MLPSYKSISLKSGASLAVLSLLICASASANGLPSNGHFVSGQGQIGKAGQSLTVKQSSTTGIINWSSFSVGAKNSVSFNNGSGATLNMVSGGNLSRIAGTLHATGSLYLMNGAGVIVSGSGHVVTGGNFVATSGTISGGTLDSDNLYFHDPRAAVTNHGSIVAGGVARLSGTSAINTGTIAASQVGLYASTGTAQAGGTLTATGSSHRDATLTVISQSDKTRVTGDLVASGTSGPGTIETSGRSVAITGRVDAGNGGTWLVDPTNLLVGANAAKTIGNTLNAGTNVTLKTTANGASGPGTTKHGHGDILFDAPITWGSTATLTADAYHSVHFVRTMDVTGDGNVTLITNDGGTGGEVRFFGDGTLEFGHLSSDLTIDGARYTLVNNITTLASDITGNASGDYALANDYDASADGTYSSAAIATTFTGTFEGLGHSISNFTVAQSSGNDAGLFAQIGTGGSVEYLNLENIKISAAVAIAGGLVAELNGGSVLGVSVSGVIHTTLVGAAVGGLAGATSNGSSVTSATSAVQVFARGAHQVTGGLIGASSGSVTSSSATGSVSCGGIDAYCGGLIGDNGGAISSSSASGGVTIQEDETGGGLVGLNTSTATISSSQESGAVEIAGATRKKFPSTLAGGLVGQNLGLVSASSATGPVGSVVAGDITLGGLVGSNSGTIDNSSARGNINYLLQQDNGITGALVGDNAHAGVIDTSHASGSIVGGAAFSGGLVGQNAGTISGSAASGAVEGSLSVGGLVGVNESGSIDQSQAHGTVQAESRNSFAGGLVGLALGSITNSFATGNVSGDAAGGLVGSLGEDGNQLAARIKNSYATGNVSGVAFAGGLIGATGSVKDEPFTISNSFCTGAVAATVAGTSLGGFAGSLTNVNVTDSYATGSVTGETGSHIGGFAGVVTVANIDQAYATGSVSGAGKAAAGGFAGSILGENTVTNSYATGAVKGGAKSKVGGFVGATFNANNNSIPDIETSYATGTVSGGKKALVGGFVGKNHTANFSSDYWDTTTSHTTNAAGNSAAVTGITALTTAQFQSGLPAGFDSSVWAEDPTINGGLPYLISLASSY